MSDDYYRFKTVYSYFNALKKSISYQYSSISNGRVDFEHLTNEILRLLNQDDHNKFIVKKKSKISNADVDTKFDKIKKCLFLSWYSESILSYKLINSNNGVPIYFCAWNLRQLYYAVYFNFSATLYLLMNEKDIESNISHEKIINKCNTTFVLRLLNEIFICPFNCYYNKDGFHWIGNKPFSFENYNNEIERMFKTTYNESRDKKYSKLKIENKKLKGKTIKSELENIDKKIATFQNLISCRFKNILDIFNVLRKNLNLLQNVQLIKNKKIHKNEKLKLPIKRDMEIEPITILNCLLRWRLWINYSKIEPFLEHPEEIECSSLKEALETISLGICLMNEYLIGRLIGFEKLTKLMDEFQKKLSKNHGESKLLSIRYRKISSLINN